MGLRRPRGAAIRTVRIEAPTTSSATQLVRDLVPFAQTDLVPLGDERWEVRVEESSEDELDAVLHAVARWAVDCQLKTASVRVDGEQIELPEPS
ncbi:MAG TPA: hypothetical protein VMG74_04080 [Gaiellaceae bacterium]|nr:hypothetical protein [Gaiellaceae bacterium]